MKSLIFTSLLFITTLTTTAQETETLNKWSYGFELNPTLIGESRALFNKYSYTNKEQNKSALNGVAKIYYQLNSKFNLSIGIGYSNVGEYITSILNENGEPYIGDDSWFCVTADYAHIEYNNTFTTHHNIQIPLQISYSFLNRFFINTGASALFNFSNELIMSDRSRRFKDKNSDYRILNFSVQLGVGYEFYKKEKLTLYIQPMIEKYGLTVYNINYPLWNGPLSTGLVIGAKF